MVATNEHTTMAASDIAILFFTDNNIVLFSGEINNFIFHGQINSTFCDET
jgi:hypothetical protein